MNLENTVSVSLSSIDLSSINCQSNERLVMAIQSIDESKSSIREQSAEHAYEDINSIDDDVIKSYGIAYNLSIIEQRSSLSNEPNFLLDCEIARKIDLLKNNLSSLYLKNLMATARYEEDDLRMFTDVFYNDETLKVVFNLVDNLMEKGDLFYTGTRLPINYSLMFECSSITLKDVALMTLTWMKFEIGSLLRNVIINSRSDYISIYPEVSARRFLKDVIKTAYFKFARVLHHLKGFIKQGKDITLIHALGGKGFLRKTANYRLDDTSLDLNEEEDFRKAKNVTQENNVIFWYAILSRMYYLRTYFGQFNGTNEINILRGESIVNTHLLICFDLVLELETFVTNDFICRNSQCKCVEKTVSIYTKTL